MPRLAVVLPAVPVADGRMALSDKTVSGLRAFQERWDGPVLAVGPPVPADPSGNLGTRWYAAGDLDLQILAADPASTLRSWAPDVCQVALAPRDLPVLELGAPCVVVAENPPLEQLRYARAEGTSVGPRVAGGALRRAWQLRRMLSAAAALACNGWAVWAAYGDLARRSHAVAPLLYFDTRLSRARVEEAAARLAGGRGAGPLRLAYSGRLHPAKGAQFAVGASQRLAAAGVGHTLTVYGTGPLEGELRAAAGPQVRFAGDVPFEPDWVEAVGSGTDLMVLPHVQGDPSGTYLESAGLGVPVVGFRNAALQGHVEHFGCGWTVTVGDEVALVERLAALATDAEGRQTAALAGVDALRRHCLEETFDARVAQLAAVAAQR